jgi:hypothetical protein
MSFNGPLQPTQTLCSLVQNALGAGGVLATGLVGSATQPFYAQTSKIVGVSGGVAGNQYSITINPITQVLAAAGQAQITIASSEAGDRSILTVYWVNSVFPGLSPC